MEGRTGEVRVEAEAKVSRLAATAVNAVVEKCIMVGMEEGVARVYDGFM